jgi:hypothetical protein
MGGFVADMWPQSRPTDHNGEHGERWLGGLGTAASKL